MKTTLASATRQTVQLQRVSPICTQQTSVSGQPSPTASDHVNALTPSVAYITYNPTVRIKNSSDKIQNQWTLVGHTIWSIPENNKPIN